MAATIDAVEAHRLGLVREVHPPEELLPAAMELAHRLAAGPTLVFGLGKALTHRAVSADLESYLAPCSGAADPGRGGWPKPSR